MPAPPHRILSINLMQPADGMGWNGTYMNLSTADVQREGRGDGDERSWWLPGTTFDSSCGGGDGGGGIERTPEGRRLNVIVVVAVNLGLLLTEVEVIVAEELLYLT